MFMCHGFENGKLVLYMMSNGKYFNARSILFYVNWFCFKFNGGIEILESA